MAGKARAALAAALLVLSVAGAGTLSASVSGELVVADRRMGVALYGFDPVAYFLEARAQMGSESFELSFQNFVWRFRSEANRAAFRARPDAYVPRFGGYDPVALTRGVPVAGDPTIFALHEGRLYLFQKAEHRAAFLAAPAAVIEVARANWPGARRLLVH